MLLFFVLLTVGLAADPLTTEFFNFLRTQHVSYPRGEMKLRLGLYRKNVADIQAHNELPNKKFEQGVNMFTALTEAEKEQYLGLRNNSAMPTPLAAPSVMGLPPRSFDHTTLGHVTPVKSQGSCGSCWAFSAIGAFEAEYAIKTGTLKSFSEQEALDCSYPDTKDGCGGGWYSVAWNYVKKTGRLGLMSDIPYKAKDGACTGYSQKRNGAYNIVVTGSTRIAKGDNTLAATVAERVPAVAITVESDFYPYKSGLYDGCNVPKSVNHGVTLVGYEIGYWKVKNSWGAGWGESGYIRMAREKHSICHISDAAEYPILALSPWKKTPDSTATKVALPNAGSVVHMKVKCVPDGTDERVKLFTFRNGAQTGHIELIIGGGNKNEFSLFCKGAGNKSWYGGARFVGKNLTPQELGSCDAQGFRYFEYKQTGTEYQVILNGVVKDRFTSQGRGKCNLMFNQVSFQTVNAPEAYYRFD